jgi:hypothetical protein
MRKLLAGILLQNLEAAQAQVAHPVMKKAAPDGAAFWRA